jgi:rhodanese-related sulfurtransferase|tara:strand:- start:345 stop:740 length:396 start_codon:yes stop_codon:yes gene_type:complete
MIKLKNSVNDLIIKAKKSIRHLTAEEAVKLHVDKNNLFIDLRDIREISKSGRILGAKHVPRGMLEFWIDPNSPYHKEFFNQDFHFIFYCASDWRSALSTETANNIGLLNTSHMLGGFSRWVELNGPIEPPK